MKEVLILCAALLVTSPALAAEEQSVARQILVTWFPLILFVALWIFFIRIMGIRKQRELIDKQRELIDKYPEYMAAIESKLDRIAVLLERGPPSRPSE